jgi:IS1 family transposase
MLSLMNRLSLAKRVQVIHLLCEGSSLRAASRIVDCSIVTVMKLLVDVGEACREYQDKALRNLPCRRLQLDEIWAFCYAKQKNVETAKRQDLAYGDIWTWTALDADSKLMVSWMVGGRDSEFANAFIADLAGRLANRVQITSDGHAPYLAAIEKAFGADVDYAQLVKIYGQTAEGQRRYSPPECIGCQSRSVEGSPDPAHISTSYVERSNLTIRMSNRRFTRLTNAFSKKAENHMHAFSIFAMHYNFARIHKTLRVTPAMESEVSDHVWSIEEIVSLADQKSN